MTIRVLRAMTTRSSGRVLELVAEGMTSAEIGRELPAASMTSSGSRGFG